MGCCSSGKEEAHGSEIFVKYEKRSCTNIIWLIIYTIFWIGFLGIMIFGAVEGDFD